MLPSSLVVLTGTNYSETYLNQAICFGQVLRLLSFKTQKIFIWDFKEMSGLNSFVWIRQVLLFFLSISGLNETQTLLCELRDDLDQLRNIPTTPDSVIEVKYMFIGTK